MSDNQDMSKLVDGLTSDPQTWSNSSLVSVSQLTPSGLDLLMKTAFDMRSLVRTKGGDESLKHRVLASIFFEASTRTSCSFQTAMMRLGGTVIHVDAGTGGNSSSKKGETVSDTIKCLQCYTDVAVLRHPVTGTVTDSVLNGGLVKPLINAGDGTGEHPTQALLDLFTIVDELDLFGQPDASKNEPLTVVLLGDLRHGRTVHSLAKLLARSQQGFLKRRLVLRYCSPTTLRMPDYIKVYIDKIAKSAGCDITQEEYIGESEKVVKNAIENANVLYVTRVQKERFKSTKDYDVVKGAYVIDAKLMKQAPEKLIVMHPLPRVDEINTDFDPDPRAAYFRQMENGLFVRMAILSLVVAKGF